MRQYKKKDLNISWTFLEKTSEHMKMIEKRR